MCDNEIDYEKLNKDFLDTLPLRKPEKGEEIRDYRDWMEKEFADVKMPKELHGELLDWMDNYDLAAYLAQRFGMNWTEKICVYMQ